jgi:hypothetical protein
MRYRQLAIRILLTKSRLMHRVFLDLTDTYIYFMAVNASALTGSGLFRASTSNLASAPSALISLPVKLKPRFVYVTAGYLAFQSSNGTEIRLHYMDLSTNTVRTVADASAGTGYSTLTVVGPFVTCGTDEFSWIISQFLQNNAGAASKSESTSLTFLIAFFSSFSFWAAYVATFSVTTNLTTKSANVTLATSYDIVDATGYNCVVVAALWSAEINAARGYYDLLGNLQVIPTNQWNKDQVIILHGTQPL